MSTENYPVDDAASVCCCCGKGVPYKQNSYITLDARALSRIIDPGYFLNVYIGSTANQLS